MIISGNNIGDKGAESVSKSLEKLLNLTSINLNLT